MKWLILTVLVMSLGLLPAVAMAQEAPTSCDTQPTEIVDENCVSNEQLIQQTDEEVPTDENPIEKGEPNPETVAGTPAELAPQPEVLGVSTTPAAPTLVDTGTQTWPYILIGILIILESVTLFKFTSDIN